ncbi:hypothetical protein LV75_004148 [Actinokineospora diospyrosa]|uniref:Uncharacterized protein n=1 Tax=Actinokineospora diospyrosa TaxID=103728 RepID=A0ABT1IG93_9PSEU|nr:hypothetical protein [Actinokineospora diospyrosa]
MPTRPPSGPPQPTCSTLDTRNGRCHLSPLSVALPTQPLDSRTLRCQLAFRQVRLSPPAQRLDSRSRWCQLLDGVDLFCVGDDTRSVSARQGQSFRPLLCGSATGVVGAPRKTGPPHRAKLENRGSGAEFAARRRGRPPEPKAEARIPCPASPTTAYVKINLIKSPQIHSLARSTNKPGAANGACGQPQPLWTTKQLVTATSDPTAPHPRSTEPRAPDIQPTERDRHNGSSKQQPVDSRTRCGQPEPADNQSLRIPKALWTTTGVVGTRAPADNHRRCRQPQKLWATRAPANNHRRCRQPRARRQPDQGQQKGPSANRGALRVKPRATSRTSARWSQRSRRRPIRGRRSC